VCSLVQYKVQQRCHKEKKKVLCSTNLVEVIQFQNSKQFALSCLQMRCNNSNANFCLTANCHPAWPNHTTYRGTSNKLLINSCSETKTSTKQSAWSSPYFTAVKVWGCPSQNLHQWIIQLLTHHKNYAYLQLYSAVCAPDDGCKWYPKHVRIHTNPCASHWTFNRIYILPRYTEPWTLNCIIMFFERPHMRISTFKNCRASVLKVLSTFKWADEQLCILYTCKEFWLSWKWSSDTNPHDVHFLHDI
jgi:hypothetical protein